MPQLPNPQPTVAPTGASGVFQRLDPGPMGEATARAGANIGRELAQAGDAMHRQQMAFQSMQNETLAKEADTKATAALDELQFNPESGFLTTLGKRAVDGFQTAREAAEKIREEALSALQNPEARRMAAGAIESRVRQAIVSMSRHTAGENRRWQVGTSEARAETSLQDAALDYADESKFRTALGTARNEAIDQGELLGWDVTKVRILQQKYTDEAWTLRLDSELLHNPVGALRRFQANMNEVSPLKRVQLAQKLYQHAAPVLAAEYILAGGPLTPVVPDTPKVKEGERLARGLRNNNPGNIQMGAEKWEGEVQGVDPRYASFATPEAGIRALGKNLLAYQERHGINTVEGIVARWAPATENDTNGYIAVVAKALKVEPGEALDLRNKATLGKLARAMILVENGSQPYSDAVMSRGLDAALGAAPLAKADTKDGAAPFNLATMTPSQALQLRTGHDVIDSLPPEQKMHVLQLARAEALKNQAEVRIAVDQRVKDAGAELLATGRSDQMPSPQELIAAHGQQQGMATWARLQELAQTGQKIQQVKALPSAELIEMKRVKPAPGEGFADRQRSYQLLEHAIDQQLEQRRADPMAYAAQAGGYGVKPITNFGNPEEVAGELARRAAAAPQIAKDYGTRLTLLSKPEGAALAQTLKVAPIPMQKQHLATLFNGVGDMELFKATMQAVAPDQPVLAAAGIMQARQRTHGPTKTMPGGDVADLVLRGQALLYPPSREDGQKHEGGRSLVKMPEDKLLANEFQSVVGDAFKDKPEARDLFLQTSRAIYAALAAQAGDYSGVINSDRMSGAVQLATGGVDSYKGTKIVLPWAMKVDDFQGEVKSRAAVLAPLGLKTTAAELSQLPLENLGDGTYLFVRGSGYVVDKNGRPLVLDMNRPGPKPVEYAPPPETVTFP